jgi:proline racemase
MKPGEQLTHESIIGSRFEGRIAREARVGSLAGVVPAIRGRAWVTGVRTVMLDPTDPWPQGYVVADTWGLSTETRQE